MQPLRWFRRGHRSTGARERLFVGRWGVFGPELYLVGKRMRRLAGQPGPYWDASPGGPPPPGLAFARQMLAEVMLCQPATQLARAFADAHLEPVPDDGFVLSTSEIEAWLEARNERHPPLRG